jgi:hypothetical protein
MAEWRHDILRLYIIPAHRTDHVARFIGHGVCGFDQSQIAVVCGPQQGLEIVAGEWPLGLYPMSGGVTVLLNKFSQDCGTVSDSCL